jgi:hypothetical protein
MIDPCNGFFGAHVGQEGIEIILVCVGRGICDVVIIETGVDSGAHEKCSSGQSYHSVKLAYEFSAKRQALREALIR